jgi:hypothetical protein
MKAEEFSERLMVLNGWQVNISSYRADDVWHAKADNVSPGANLARGTGATREEAETSVLKRAEELLARTKRHQL